MGLGVLEDRSSLQHVPGTVFLNDSAGDAGGAAHELEHGSGKDANIVLSPQPSEDPSDPLNWPMWQKEVIIGILSLGAMLNAGTNGPLLNASYLSIAEDLQTDLTTVVLASGHNLLAAGCIGPFVAAFSRKFGKRPVFLVSTLFAIIGTAVGEAEVSYTYLLAARIIQGFSTSAFESLIVATVGDIYFVHHRGLRVSFINFILNSSFCRIPLIQGIADPFTLLFCRTSSLASIICGLVFADLGYLWLFHLFQILLVIQFEAMFLFCPETTYNRDSRYKTDETKHEKLDELAKVEMRHHEEALTSSDLPKKKTFVQSLAVWTGVYLPDSIFKFLLGPFITLLNPAALYAIIVSGLLNSWYVGSAIILAGIFAGPPWMYGPASIGYFGAGPFIGGMIGSIFVGWLSDTVIKWISKRNGGTYEPEFRLVFMSLALVFCTVGMFLFGYTMSIGSPSILCAFFQGMMMFGVLIRHLLHPLLRPRRLLPPK